MTGTLLSQRNLRQPISTYSFTAAAQYRDWHSRHVSESEVKDYVPSTRQFFPGGKANLKITRLPSVGKECRWKKDVQRSIKCHNFRKWKGLEEVIIYSIINQFTDEKNLNPDKLYLLMCFLPWKELQLEFPQFGFSRATFQKRTFYFPFIQANTDTKGGKIESY